MKPEAQRLAIAEALGWTKLEAASHQRLIGVKPGAMRVVQKAEYIESNSMVPDYLSDLNAMRDAIMTLSDNQRDLANLKLCEIVNGYFDYSETYDFDAAINATAAERAEAFLKTIGKWQP